jgi:hypothetical protein
LSLAQFLSLRAARNARGLRSFAPFELGSRTKFFEPNKLKRGASGSPF